MTNVDHRFVIEGYIWAALFGVGLVLSCIQLLVEIHVRRMEERRKDDALRLESAALAKGKLPRVGKLQYYFHRVGFGICLLGVIDMAVDPYYAWGIYPDHVPIGLSRNRSCILLWAAGLAFHMPIELLFRLSFNRTAPKRYCYIMYAGVLLVHVTTNVNWLISLVAKSYRGMDLLVLLTFAYANISLIVSMFWGMLAFRAEVTRMEKATAIEVQELPPPSVSELDATQRNVIIAPPLPAFPQPSPVANDSVDSDADGGGMARTGRDGSTSLTVQIPTDEHSQLGPLPTSPHGDDRNFSRSIVSYAPSVEVPGFSRLSADPQSVNTAPSSPTSSIRSPYISPIRKPALHGLRRTLERPLKLMTIFGCACSVAMGASAAVCINLASSFAGRPGDVVEPEDFSSYFFSLTCVFNIVHVFCCAMGLWYS